jgi:hypothetical protein
MDWISAHLAVLDWAATHIGLPLFFVLGGFFAARWTDRLKRKTDEQRATVQMALHLAEYVRRWRDEFYKVEAATPDPASLTQWSTTKIASPLKDRKVAELVPSLRPPVRNALLKLDERTPSYADEIERLRRWQPDDVDTDAPAVLAEFVLAVDAVLLVVRQAADLPGLPEEETGISYVRRWLRARKEWIRRRDDERSDRQRRKMAA